MKVGDYVRTKKQGIKKIDTIFENATINKYGYEDKYNDYEYYIIRTDDIIKSSPNIIDLIEVGDYVNGWKVMKKTDDYFFIGDESEGTWHLLFDEIKSIVTKEQFESMEYKVGI